jgi:preprotein translocase subunit SecG
MSTCSGLLLAPAIGLFIVGGILGGSMSEIFKDTDSFLGRIPTVITFIFAVMAVFLGVFGAICGQKCVDKKCCLCVWGFIALIFTVIFFVFGIVFSVAASLSSSGIDTFCETGNIPGLPFKTEAILPDLNQFDYLTGNVTANNMCTAECPCAYNLDLTKYDEATLAQFNRTKTTVGSGSNLVKLVLAADATTTPQYANFFKCYGDNQGEFTTSSSNANKVIMKLTDVIQKVIEYFESKFMCSGVCRKGPFYFFSDMSLGQPTKTCLVSFKEVFSGKITAIAILLWVTFVLALFAYLAHFGICCRCGKDKTS